MLRFGNLLRILGRRGTTALPRRVEKRAWPSVLKPFAAEAWRRAERGELTDNELYTSDAQWCELYDRMHIHEPDETFRWLALAADYGESPEDGV